MVQGSLRSVAPVMLAILIAIFGDPRAVLYVRVLATISALIQCAPADTACPMRHEVAAATIAIVASEAPGDTEANAAAMIGLGWHETRFATVLQADGGPARSWWQVEPVARGAMRKGEQERLATDTVYAATRALAAWHRGSGAYACGDAHRCPRAAAELRRYVARATWALAAR